MAKVIKLRSGGQQTNVSLTSTALRVTIDAANGEGRKIIAMGVDQADELADALRDAANDARRQRKAADSSAGSQ
jgi:hypothetical protein